MLRIYGFNVWFGVHWESVFMAGIPSFLTLYTLSYIVGFGRWYLFNRNTCYLFNNLIKYLSYLFRKWVSCVFSLLWVDLLKGGVIDSRGRNCKEDVNDREEENPRLLPWPGTQETCHSTFQSRAPVPHSTWLETRLTYLYRCMGLNAEHRLKQGYL